jgi:hypothetical protein
MSLLSCLISRSGQDDGDSLSVCDSIFSEDTFLIPVQDHDEQRNTVIANSVISKEYVNLIFVNFIIMAIFISYID